MLIIVEMTGGYSLILPLMIANMLAYGIDGNTAECRSITRCSSKMASVFTSGNWPTSWKASRFAKCLSIRQRT